MLYHLLHCAKNQYTYKKKLLYILYVNCDNNDVAKWIRDIVLVVVLNSDVLSSSVEKFGSHLLIQFHDASV